MATEEEARNKLIELLDTIRSATNDYENNLDKIAENTPSEVKLAITKWVMDKIVDHAREGGTYRYLIYDRLGFGPEAYAPLCNSGMTISNEFDLDLKDNLREALRSHDIEAAKRVLGWCDEPDCFKDAHCGFPTDDGSYRHTCSQHSKMLMEDDDV